MNVLKRWTVYGYASLPDNGAVPEVTVTPVKAETAEEAMRIVAEHFAVFPDHAEPVIEPDR